ncbi:MAG: hypothetical protein IJD92_05410 [Bacilli bacterium]|nr:hypothetical protein [Bacilli bacterium]
MKKFKVFCLFCLLFIFSFVINYFSIANNDLIWNYGFCYNVANGLDMYSDFNMVITPLYPTIFGLIMKLLGNNMLMFFLSNAILPTLIFFIIYKNYKKVFLEMILLLSFVSNPNYNLLCLFFLFLLFYLEDKKKNDYIIGIVLGLVFLTKSPMGLLSLASLYYIKDIRKVIKRAFGFLIPNLIFIVYFYFNNNLIDYFNYAFGSLLDFATKNVRSTFGIVIFIMSIIYLIYLFRKKKDIKILYILFFQIMSYPIFNGTHILISAVPTIFYILLNIENKFYLKYKKFLAIFLICPILSVIFQVGFLDLKNGTNALEGKLIESKYLDDSIKIKQNVDNLENTYFIMYEAYYNKLLLGLDINKYDVMLSGNLGYDGEKKAIEYFDSLSMGTKFILFREYEGGQAPLSIYNHIKNNYDLIKTFDKYEVYIK